MEIRQLKYFISVAKHLSFTRAAQECFVVQTTMTHQIAALENELGVRLFERSNRSVRLTAEGEAFLPQAREIVRHCDDSLEIIRNMKGNYRGFIRIGYWGNLVRGDLPEILRSFRRENPTVRVGLSQCNVDQLLDMLEKGKLDVGFCCYFDLFPELKWLGYRELFSDRLYALLPKDHPLAGRDVLSNADIKDEPMVTFPGIGSVDLCNRIEKTSSISIVAEHHKSIAMLVEAGYGISLCAGQGLCSDVDNLALVPMDESVEQIRVVAVWNKNRVDDILKNFLTETERYFSPGERQ